MKGANYHKYMIDTKICFDRKSIIYEILLVYCIIKEYKMASGPSSPSAGPRLPSVLKCAACRNTLQNVQPPKEDVDSAQWVPELRG